MGLALFAFGCGLYLVYFGLIAKPEWSLYGYFGVWLGIPAIRRHFAVETHFTITNHIAMVLMRGRKLS